MSLEEPAVVGSGEGSVDPVGIPLGTSEPVVGSAEGSVDPVGIPLGTSEPVVGSSGSVVEGSTTSSPSGKSSMEAPIQLSRALSRVWSILLISKKG